MYKLRYISESVQFFRKSMGERRCTMTGLKVFLEGLFWNFYAFLYDTILGLLPYRELLAKSVDALDIKERNLKILDAGCGTGNLAATISLITRRDIVLEGVDASPAMLKRAKNKAQKFSWAHYTRMDLNQPLPYPAGSFDCVVALNVLYTLREPQEILQEFHRILKFGGLLVIANPKINPKVRAILSAHMRMIAGQGWRRGLLLFLKTLLIFPRLIVVIALNVLVIKRLADKNIYHFFDAETLEANLKKAHFEVLCSELAYGDSDVFIVASKILSMPDRSDM